MTGDLDVALVPEPGRADAFTLRVGGADQSHVDLADPRRLVFEYVQRIADVLDTAFAAPERIGVVHVGGAGLTLARYVAATRPTSAQIVLEPDERLTDYVREHLPLPPRSGIKVRPVDGRTGLAAVRDGYADVVVLDAFDGPVVPAGLTTAEAFAAYRRVLRPGGLLVANLSDQAPFGYLRRVVTTAGTVFDRLAASAEPATLKGRRYGNVLLVASDAELGLPDLRRRAASSPFPYRVLAGDELRSTLGGGAVLTDADPLPSPSPPRGARAFG